MFARAFAATAVLLLAVSCVTTSPPVELAAGVSAPVVTTQLGDVEGLREDGLAVFRGIPFAAPPIGESAGRRRSQPRIGRVSSRRRVSRRLAFSPRCRPLMELRKINRARTASISTSGLRRKPPPKCCR